jgi:hypothetical protein
MSKGRRVGLLVCLLWFAQAVQAEMSINEGLWEFDIRYDFIGIPQHFPEYAKKQCISTAAPVPTISRPGQECGDRLQGRFGQTFTWQVDCTTEWEMVQGMGRSHYLGNQAIGDVHLQVLNPFNPPQPMLFRLRGRRLGDCGN